jgi:hypothetical protein
LLREAQPSPQTFFCVARLPFQPDGDLVEIVGPSAHGTDWDRRFLGDKLSRPWLADAAARKNFAAFMKGYYPP